MDIQNKKKILQEEFAKNQQLLAQLAERQAQLRGQFALLEELEKEEGENRASKKRIEKIEEEIEK